MRHLLLTNDDGVDSPALPPFARALQDLGDVTVVVPDRQRSWIGKAISRGREINTTTTERQGIPVTTCTGYPADATQLGVHVVCGPPPDIVLSGINLGLNHGTAFLLSSGTVGAAVEGSISGLPSIAFSTGVDGEHYTAWRRHAGSRAAADQWTAHARGRGGVRDAARPGRARQGGGLTDAASGSARAAPSQRAAVDAGGDPGAVAERPQREACPADRVVVDELQAKAHPSAVERLTRAHDAGLPGVVAQDELERRSLHAAGRRAAVHLDARAGQ